MKRKTVFVNVVTNITLIAIVMLVFYVSFFGETVNVFSANDNGVYYYGDVNSNKVSLMINVYWGSEYITPLLEILDKHNVKATFFVGGYWAAAESELLVNILLKGHELGNHGFHHKEHESLSLQKNVEEIMSCHELVKVKTGYEMQLFAPPSGSFSKSTLKAATDNGYKVIMWSKDTIDWRDHNSALIFERATQSVKGGDLILMHPTKETVDALERIIVFLTEKGFSLVSVSQNISS